MTPPLLGIYGGTFDPIHQGHLSAALFVQQFCQLDQLQLLPCHLPPHRESPSLSAHRLAMVQLAIKPFPQLGLCLYELNKHTASYTVETLQALQQQHPEAQLCFVIGMDSLQNFTRWHRWQEILTLCHLLVLERSGYSKTQGDAPTLLERYGVHSVDTLRQQKNGGILLLPNPLWDVSASAVRAGLQSESLQIAAVTEYIQQHQLYSR